MSIIQVSNLQKAFGDNVVLKDISFSVEKEEVLSIIGPSGSGKSTLLRCINQLETIDNGTVEICGTPLTQATLEGAKYADKATCRALQMKVGLVFQNFNLFPHMSILDNILSAPVHVQKRPRAEVKEEAMALLSRMGLADKADFYPYQLSGGQAQRVSITRALAMRPEVLFFDEPTSALDPELTGEVLKVIRDLKGMNMTMIIVTHEMSFAHDVSDKVIFMDGGIIQAAGTPDEIFCENNDNERMKAFLGKLESR